MAASRLIRFWFALSDAFAMLALLTASLGLAIGAYVLVFGVSPRDAEEFTTQILVGTFVLWGAVALGAYLLLRRRALGVALVSALAIDALLAGDLVWAMVILLFIVVVFLFPFALVLLQARRSILEKVDTPH